MNAVSLAEEKKRVLLVSLYHPELVRGGAQLCCYELFHGLKEEPGIEPYFLAATDQSYPALYKPGAFITGFEGRENEFLYLSADYDFLWHRTTSPRHIEAYAELLRTLQPAVVHFQHFLFFGIDFLSLTRRVLPNCRIVFTFHEYLTICDARGHMVRLTDGSLCSQSSPIRCHQCFPDRTPDQFAMRKAWFMRHLSVVDRYACACRFQIEHHVAWGIPREKISHVRNGQLSHAPAEPLPVPPGPKNRFGFFGQLIDAKGVHIILRAARILRSEGFEDFTIEINGDNLRFATPVIREEFEAFFAEEDRRPPVERRVFFNGSYQVDQIGTRMARIDWSLVPSTWWEAFGLVISEAWMFRRPVICSNIGGMAERIDHDVNGLHFQVSDPRSLALTIKRAATETGLWERLSAAAPEPPSRTEVARGYRALYGI
jgi:glycosyltransferase involved in cell wall biosynthesis